MQAQPFLPRPCSLCHGLKKRMMGPHSFGSSPAQAARPAHSAQPAGRGEQKTEQASVWVQVHLQSLIDRLGGK